MINYQEARRRRIDNRGHMVNTYWSIRRKAERERAIDREKRLAARDRYLANRKSSAPPRLDSHQLDPSTGEINWPPVLTKPGYAVYRQDLVKLFAQRAGGGTPPGWPQSVHSTSTKMTAALKNEIRTIPTFEYIEAMKFLKSLHYESRFRTL